jgi:hypothetical protein
LDDGRAIPRLRFCSPPNSPLSLMSVASPSNNIKDDCLYKDPCSAPKNGLPFRVLGRQPRHSLD